MRIQLYDRGLPQGKKLFADLEIVCQRLQVDYDPEYIKDSQNNTKSNSQTLFFKR